MQVWNNVGGSKTFNDYIKHFKNGSIADLDLKASNPLLNNQLDNPDYAYTDVTGANKVQIVFNTDRLVPQVQLETATTMIHELIHATLFRWMMSVAPNGNLAFDGNAENWETYRLGLKNNFFGIWDFYTRYEWNSTSSNDEPVAQHEQIASHYRNIIINALKEYQPNLDETIYEALSWEGLEGTSSYELLNIEDLNYTFVIDDFANTQTLCGQ